MNLYEFIRSDWTHRIAELDNFIDAVEFEELMNDDVPVTKPSFGGRNEYTHSDVDFLKSKKSEIQKWLIKTASGEAHFNEATFLRDSKRMKSIDWLLNQSELRNSLHDFDFLYCELKKKNDIRYRRRKWLELQIYKCQSILDHLNKELQKCESPNPSNLEKEESCIKKHLMNSNSDEFRKIESIAFKFLFSELWKRSPDEISEFLKNIPTDILPIAHEIIDTFGMSE